MKVKNFATVYYQGLKLSASHLTICASVALLLLIGGN